MSYANIKPEYYRMKQPDSPWHAGAPGWKSAPWPGWGENPNLVGPPRLAVEGLGNVRKAAMYQQVKGVGEYFQGTSGLGAFYAPEYERPISGLGSSMRNGAGTGCGCAGVGVGDAATTITTSPSSVNSATKGALMIAGCAVVMMALIAIPSIWDE